MQPLLYKLDNRVVEIYTFFISRFLSIGLFFYSWHNTRYPALSLASTHQHSKSFKGKILNAKSKTGKFIVFNVAFEIVRRNLQLFLNYVQQLERGTLAQKTFGSLRTLIRGRLAKVPMQKVLKKYHLATNLLNQIILLKFCKKSEKPSNLKSNE